MIKRVKVGTRFDSVDTQRKKVAEVMKGPIQNDLHLFFDPWEIRLEHCRDRGGGHIDEDSY